MTKEIKCHLDVVESVALKKAVANELTSSEDKSVEDLIHLIVKDGDIIYSPLSEAKKNAKPSNT